MAFVSPEDKEVDFKIVWYGVEDAALLECLSELGRSMGAETSSYATDDDITTAVLPVAMGVVAGWRTSFTLQTVPAESPHPAHRLLIVKASDGAVFVSSGRAAEDRARVGELREHVEAHGYDWASFPVVAITADDPAALGLEGRPRADDAMGAMKAVAKLALMTLKTG